MRIQARLPVNRVGPPGEGRLGCILWAVALAIAVMIAFQAAPVKIRDVEFGDFVDEQAQFAGRKSGQAIRKAIIKHAKELDVPLDPDDLKVEKSTTRVRISYTYDVDVDFGFYTYNWTFDHSIDRPVFIV